MTAPRQTDPPPTRDPLPAAPAGPDQRPEVYDRIVDLLERTPVRVAYAVAVGAVLVALLGALTVAPRPSAAGVLGLAVVALCLAALYRSVTGDRFAPAAITFWAFVLVWVGVPPLLQIRDGRLPWPDTPLRHLYLGAQLILLASVVAFWWGYFGRPGHPNVRRPQAQRARRFQVTVAYAAIVTGATAALAAVSLPLTGGLAVRFRNRDAVTEALTKAGMIGGADQALSGLLNMLPAAASLASLVLCLRCLKARAATGKRSRGVLYAATAVAVALNLIFNNPLSASRFISLSTVLAAILVLVDFSALWRRIAFAAAMVGGLAFVYPLADALRNDTQRGSLRIGTEAYYTYDFDGFQQTVNSVYYVGENGVSWGHHILSALLFWVPRSLWESKAMPAGFAVAGSRGYTFQNLSLPLWAELYIEFWFFGLLLMFLYGRIARRLDRSLSGETTALGGTLALIFIAGQIGFVRGPLGAQVPFLASALMAALSVFILLWIVGLVRRRPRRE